MPSTFPDISQYVKAHHREPLFSTIVQTSASGKESRIALYPANRWKWELEVSLMPLATYQSLEAFYISANGQLGSFNYTDPTNGNTYLVRFAEDTYDFQNPYYQQWGSFSITLVSTDV